MKYYNLSYLNKFRLSYMCLKGLCDISNNPKWTYSCKRILIGLDPLIAIPNAAKVGMNRHYINTMLFYFILFHFNMLYDVNVTIIYWNRSITSTFFSLILAVLAQITFYLILIVKLQYLINTYDFDLEV